MRKELKKLTIALTSAALLIVTVFSSSLVLCARGIPTDDAFDNLTWKELFRTESYSQGRMRSMTVTDDYIIMVRNVADDESVKDTITAYYRNDRDANGVSVTQYSEALSVSEDHLEQGNSITYNPRNGKLYLAPSTCYETENYGQILVLDPATLRVEGKEFIAYDYAVGGIEYVEDSDTYIIQGNYENNFTFLSYSSEFDQISTIGTPDILPSSTARDFTVCGNYIISAAYLDSEESAYLNIFSIFDGSKIKSITMDIPMDGVVAVAPQSVAELSSGQLIVLVEETNSAGESCAVIYESDVPYNFTVSTAVENGTISGTSSEVLRGTDYTIEFKPDSGYALSEISLDGKMLNVEEYGNSLTIPSIDADHSVVVRFAEKELVKQQNKDRKKAFERLIDKLDRTAGKRMTFGKVIGTIFLTILIIALVAFGAFIAFRFYKIKKKKKKNPGKGSGKNSNDSNTKTKASGKKAKDSNTKTKDSPAPRGRGRLSKYRGTPLDRPSASEIKERRSFRDDFDNEREKDYLYDYDDDFYDDRYDDDYDREDDYYDREDDYYDREEDYYDREDDYYDREDEFYDRDGKNKEDYAVPSGMLDITTHMTKVNSQTGRKVGGETRNLDYYYREENAEKTLIFGSGEDDEPEPDISWPDEMSDNLVGHWQDGVWVTTSAVGPNEG